MKVLFAVLLVALSISCVLCQTKVTAQFNQTLRVSTTVTDYQFFSAQNNQAPIMDLFVSASNAMNGPNGTISSSVTVYTQATFPQTNLTLNGALIANNGFPSGFSAFGGALVSGSLGAGLYIQMTNDINGNAQANLTISAALLTFAGVSLTGFSPLYFDFNTQTYVDLPTNQYTVSATNGINIYTNRSIFLVFAVYTGLSTSTTINIQNGAIAYVNVVAGRLSTLVVQEATGAALTIANISASAGRITVRVAANAAAEAAAVASTNVLISSVYTFDHSAGSTAVSQAYLQYSFAGNSNSFNASTQANAQWYTWNGSSWVVAGGSVNGGVLVYNTNHFSDWSAQSNPSSVPTSTATANPSYSPSRSSASCLAPLFGLLKYVC